MHLLQTKMTNYYNRIIEPILTAICEEYVRKFLTKTARSQRQSVKFFRDPFKLVPVDKMADLADKFTRNEILTSNEVRQIVGMLPSQDPSADELRNKNISASDSEEHLDINGNPIGPGPEGEQGLAEPMPNEPGQAENQSISAHMERIWTALSSSANFLCYWGFRQ